MKTFIRTLVTIAGAIFAIFATWKGFIDRSHAWEIYLWISIGAALTYIPQLNWVDYFSKLNYIQILVGGISSVVSIYIVSGSDLPGAVAYIVLYVIYIILYYLRFITSLND
jgi:hypothetical protein